MWGGGEGCREDGMESGGRRLEAVLNISDHGRGAELGLGLGFGFGPFGEEE